VIVHNDPFQKHEQRIGGVLLFWYANPTLIVQETALVSVTWPIHKIIHCKPVRAKKKKGIRVIHTL
jgi:hypothetical protein